MGGRSCPQLLGPSSQAINSSEKESEHKGLPLLQKSSSAQSLLPFFPLLRRPKCLLRETFQCQMLELMLVLFELMDTSVPVGIDVERGLEGT
eukprot:6133222-Amphidinium_carterae.2